MSSSTAAKAAISIRGLGKSYKMMTATESTTFGEAVVTRARHPMRRKKRERFWALNDISVDVDPGEVLGIIGRNGAGKSTLLKILSRITEPTRGEVRLRGRVGSLLEVGTGFHPELTARENIYLNGAVLGMSRREITRQFDAIVDFSGVARFLDMPVKRFSSGMSVRLAFAVAAHLEPEVMVVDEVLAVGDAEFQQRCLGKMGEVAHDDARTVLFVSHNLSAIETLCTRCIVLDRGRLEFDGATRDAIAFYAASSTSAAGGDGEFDLNEREDQWADPILRRLQVCGSAHAPPGTVRAGDGVTLRIDVQGLTEIPGAFVGVEFRTDLDDVLATVHTRMKGPRRAETGSDVEEITFDFDELPFVPGRYWLSIGVWDPIRNRSADKVERAGYVDVLPADVLGSGYDITPRQGVGGVVFTRFEWEIGPRDSYVAPPRDNEVAS